MPKTTNRPKAPELREGKPRTAKPQARGPMTLATAIPQPPEHLNDVGVQHWHEIWSLGDGVYAPSDKYTIERYCTLQQRREEYLSKIDEFGAVTKGSQDQDVVSPWAKLLQDVETKLVALEDRLGLSPESRARLGIAVIEQKSKFDEFLSKIGGDE